MFDIRYKSHHDAEAAYAEMVKNTPANQKLLEEYLTVTPSPNGRHVIYIHVPFCDKICSFCNLNRKILVGTTESYVKQLLAQIEYYGQFPYFADMKIGSVYFGGGTPTVLPGEMFVEILGAIYKNFRIADDCEVTAESTLHNLSPEKLALMQRAGINRLSIGIQTFDTEGRKFFNRTGDKQQAIQGIEMIRKHFPHTLAVDKIYNYPGETRERLMEDIRILHHSDIDSVSFYSLMIHTGSALSRRYEEQQLGTASDLEFHNIFVEHMLSDPRYELLEITKLAKRNADGYAYISLRNAGANTLPLGEGAGGQLGKFGMFQMNFERIMIMEYSPPKMIADRLYGLLQKGSFQQSDLERICKTADWSTPLIENYLSNGLICKTDAGFSYTREGLFYGNNICAEFVKAYLESITTTSAVAD